jgi:hypothetical protein
MWVDDAFGLYVQSFDGVESFDLIIEVDPTLFASFYDLLIPLTIDDFVLMFMAVHMLFNLEV